MLYAWLTTTAYFTLWLFELLQKRLWYTLDRRSQYGHGVKRTFPVPIRRRYLESSPRTVILLTAICSFIIENNERT
jgi:hypothetical protein